MQSKENNIVIFKNTKKEKETQPDYTGTVNVQGVDWSISLWIKDGKNGKFMAGNIKEPYKNMETATQKFVKSNDSDLPF